MCILFSGIHGYPIMREIIGEMVNMPADVQVLGEKEGFLQTVKQEEE